MSKKDLMLDIETLDTIKSGIILQIGACYFNRYSGEILEKFSTNIDIKSSLERGFTVGADTIKFWMSQGEEARKSVFEGEAQHVFDAMNDFNKFASSAKAIWSHATFDFVMIMHHFETLKIPTTFHYRTARDIRTLVDLADIKFTEKEPRKGVHHNALDDCIYQVQYCVQCFNKIYGIQNNKPVKSGITIQKL
jgi:hypothetical protein